MFSLPSSLSLLLKNDRTGHAVGAKYKTGQAKVSQKKEHNTDVYLYPGICQGTDCLITSPQLDM